MHGVGADSVLGESVDPLKSRHLQVVEFAVSLPKGSTELIVKYGTTVRYLS